MIEVRMLFADDSVKSIHATVFSMLEETHGEAVEVTVREVKS